MGIETKYDYIYYTVVNINDYLIDDEFTWQAAIDLINKKFENSEDENVRKFRVEGGRYCSDIDSWIRAQRRHKTRPIFTQFSNEQDIVLSGGGQLFELYEEDGDDGDDGDDDYPPGWSYVQPDHPDYWVDGLSGAGGRL